MIGAHDFPYIYPKLAEKLLTWPWLWNAKDHDGLGVNTIDTLWGWIQELFFGGLTKLGTSWSVVATIFGVILLFLFSWIGLGKLLNGYKLSKQSVFIGRLFFLTNTYILLLVDGGQLNLAVAYSLLPLSIYLLDKKIYKFSLAALFISFLDLRIIYVLCLVVLIHLLFNIRNFGHYLKLGVTTGVLLICSHAYWIFPALMSRGPMLPQTYTRSAQVLNLSFADISHALTLRQPHWWQNIYGQTRHPEWYFWLIPIIAFSSLIFYKKNKTISFWSCVGIVGIFLVKGFNTPLSGFYLWAFNNVPGWNLFRDPTKFYFLICLSFSVLWSFATNYLTKKHSWIVVGLSIYLLIVALPVYQGKMSGLFSIPRYEKDYKSLASFLETSTPGKIVWFPEKPPVGYSDPDHLSINATTLSQRRPFAVGTVGAYDTLNFLRDATHSGQLFAAAGIKYIAIAASDPIRDSQKPEDLNYRKIFTNQLSALPWISERKNFGPITLLETKTTKKLFYLTPTTNFIIGSDSIYKNQPNIFESAAIFAEEHPGILNKITNFSNANLVLNSKTKLDVTAALMPENKFIFPANSLLFSPNSTGWWKRETADFVAWRDFLQQKYNLENQDFDFGGGWAVSEGKNNLTLNLPECINNCILMARLMVSPKSGSISFFESSRLLGSVNTYKETNDISSQIFGLGQAADQTFTYKQADFLWYEVGAAEGGILEISTEGSINVVNALALISKNELTELKNKAEQLTNSYQHLTPYTSGDIYYKQINPAHYQITVSGLTSPASIIFSQNFDTFWRLGDSPSVKAYSLLNAFPLEKNGVYDVYYLPQKYMQTGLIISGFTVILFCIIILWKLR